MYDANHTPFKYCCIPIKYPLAMPTTVADGTGDAFPPLPILNVEPGGISPTSTIGVASAAASSKRPRRRSEPRMQPINEAQQPDNASPASSSRYSQSPLFYGGASMPPSSPKKTRVFHVEAVGIPTQKKGPYYCEHGRIKVRAGV